MDSPSDPPAEAPAPVVSPPPAVPPPSVGPTRRRFSWRDFFIGVGTGVVVTILGLVLLVVGASLLIDRMMANDPESSMMLPAPEFPTAAQKPVYGPADMRWTFQTLDGKPVTLADYRGKVVFLNFWATWCGPCVEELPNIRKLQETVKNDAIAFVLVSDEDRATIETFAKKKPMALPVFHAEGKSPPLFATNGIPTTFIIDPAGTVVFKYVGAAQWNHATAVTFLRGLMSR
jgi:thiol-disulfide isomerase/thioredoxin